MYNVIYVECHKSAECRGTLKVLLDGRNINLKKPFRRITVIAASTFCRQIRQQNKLKFSSQNLKVLKVKSDENWFLPVSIIDPRQVINRFCHLKKD